VKPEGFWIVNNSISGTVILLIFVIFQYLGLHASLLLMAFSTVLLVNSFVNLWFTAENYLGKHPSSVLAPVRRGVKKLVTPQHPSELRDLQREGNMLEDEHDSVA
jgi:hypothetical protein